VKDDFFCCNLTRQSQAKEQENIDGKQSKEGLQLRMMLEERQERFKLKNDVNFKKWRK
jgi:hypothetical protein